MVKHKPFTRTEMKILVFNKMKNRGLSYENACKQLEKEIEGIISIDQKYEKREKAKIKREKKKEQGKKDQQAKFKKEFAKLTKKNGKKR